MSVSNVIIKHGIQLGQEEVEVGGGGDGVCGGNNKGEVCLH